jgi:hypothetical protein
MLGTLLCQILEVDDEWNILKCTLHSRRVQKNFNYTSNSCGFFCDLNLSSNKNPNIRYEDPGVL